MPDRLVTVRLTDGSSVTLRALAIGPSGVISRPQARPTLYLWHQKHGTYWRVAEEFTEADLPALEERIQRT